VIKEWKVDRLVDALKLSRASGIPIEKFAGELIDAQRAKETKWPRFGEFDLGAGSAFGSRTLVVTREAP
jgi:hypothetical protein